MRKPYWILLLVSLLSFSFVSCNDDSAEDVEDVKPVLAVSHIDFKNDYKDIEIFAKLNNPLDVNAILSLDSLYVEEYNHHGNLVSRSVTAEVVDVKSIGAHVIDSIGIKLLVLVDLTLPQNLVDSQYAKIVPISRIYNSGNLYLSFIHADSVSASYQATDYIMSNYFVSESDTLTSKKLYRAICQKYQEINDSTTILGSSRYCAMIAFSDGNIYGMDATPIDPEHYNLQSEILSQVPLRGRPFYYGNLDNSKVGAVNDAANFLQLVAGNSCGRYFESFDWIRCEEDLLESFNVHYDDVVVSLRNPKDRIFSGENNLKLFLHSNDTSFLVLDATYSVGTVCRPVIIEGIPQSQVVVQGILLAILLIILIYIVCQLVIPYISYQIFRKRHTTTYISPNTTLNGVSVGDVCYFCKTPFQKGDRVVAKCAHTMHESCWKENDYHCTDYGRKCKHGSHYYNQDDLYDPQNAYFLMFWLIAAVIIAIIAWIGFIVYDQQYTYEIMVDMVASLKNIKPDTMEYAELISSFDNSLDQLPSFGAFLGFVFTLFLGFMASFERLYLQKIVELIVKSLISGLCGFVFFTIGFVLTMVLELDSSSSIWIDWFPWTATALASVFCATYHTRLRPKGKWFFGMLFVGIISMFLWDLLFSSNSSDYRLLLFLSNLIFSLGLVLTIAAPMPSSENYVLHVTGCIKEMDIAINKWFKQSASSRVTIGRSIDCGIQTSWDIQGNVAAVHAEIISYRRQIYVVPLEDGVYSRNKMLKVDHRYRLYHGRSFTIGTTTFTFRERDVH